MTDIDLATGLPQLPDGQYWRVIRSTGPYMAVQDIDKSIQLEVQIVRDVVSEYRQFVFFWRTYTETTTKVLTRMLVSQRDKKSGLINTPQNVLLTAQAMLEGRTKKLAIEKLVGSYPPKKLETGETTGETT